VVTEIIFLKSVHHYDSYTDFFKLAELAGFPVKRVDELDVSEPGVYITSPMNGDWREHLKSQAARPRNAHLVLWNIERPSGSGSVGQYAASNRRLLYGLEDDGTPAPCRYADEVWTSDRRLAQETELRHVVLGSHPGLGHPGKDKKYSLVHMSYTGPPRRQSIYKHFGKAETGPNCWPPQRDKVLALSKFALNVHQDHHPYMEPLRFALFAAYALPILTETLVDAWPYCDRTMAFAEYDDLVDRLRRMLKEPYEPWREMGMRCRERMTEEFEFGKVVREAVAQSVGEWR
jgi:hypothetical protein